MRSRPRALEPVRATLPNGLKVRVLEDPSLPIAAYLTVIDAGSRHEQPGRTGLAHLLEHLMFSGSKRYPKGAFDRALESSGGSPDAYTHQDFTVYLAELPARALPVLIDLEAARLCGLRLDDRAVETERSVVREEVRMKVDANSYMLAARELSALAFQAHPYRWPAFGFPADLEAISRADCLDFYRARYGPAGATVWVSGGVDADDVIGRIERAYGRLRSLGPPAPVRVEEPEQTGPRRGERAGPGQTPVVCIGVRGPKAHEGRAGWVHVLEAALGTGSGALLRQGRLRACAAYLECTWQPLRDAGVFSITAEPAPGVPLSRLEAELIRALDSLGKTLTREALARAKAQVKGQLLQLLDSRLGRANVLGTAEALTGDAHRPLDDLLALDRLEPKNLAALAEELFAPARRCTVWVRA